ncbi:MAG: hypothetical protein RLZZ110_1248 [Bacteroidota bacterium]|jgi:hypothetical protein
MIKLEEKMLKSMTLILVMFFSMSNMASAQPSITPMVGKAFADNNGASAARLGIGFQEIYKNRLGVYYMYEYRSNVILFETTTYENNKYRRDIAGLSCKVHPNFTIYGGVGLFVDGILTDQFQSKGAGVPWIIKPTGFRKEIGISFQPNDLPIVISAGYSNTIGFTSNLGWRIPLKEKHMTLQQAITADQ